MNTNTKSRLELFTRGPPASPEIASEREISREGPSPAARMSAARRAHPPLQNGAGGDDGDDERDEEEEEDGDEELEDEAEEEEEPRLKYQRLGGSVPAILSTDAAASIAVADRMVALGTHNGTLHILDFQGNQVPLTTGRSSLGISDLSWPRGSWGNGGGVAWIQPGSWHLGHL